MLKPALKRVGDKLLEDLQSQIQKDVYENEYMPNKRYYGEKDEDGSAYPTYEFYYAWKVDVNKTFSENGSSISIKYDPSKMSPVPHRSLVENITMKNVLNKILNDLTDDGYTSGLMVGSSENGTSRHVSKHREPYWDNFIKKVKSKSLIRKYIKEEAKAIGITLT